MDDRAVSVLDQYDIKVLRTWKGRGAILCDTNHGTKILKEYSGTKERLLYQVELLKSIKEKGFQTVEQIIPNSENEYISLDSDQVQYIVKDYFEGKECNVREEKECILAIEKLASLHKAMQIPNSKYVIDTPIFTLDKEYEKHNKELKKVRNYIRQKSQKTDFEIFLMKQFDPYYEKAQDVYNQLCEYDWSLFYEKIKTEGSICHGDYQYHNLMLQHDQVSIINFEKYIIDTKMRDLYLFMRKVLEKNDWNIDLGIRLLESYQKVQTITEEEMMQLYYRFDYPEKFWKIVNYYYNSGKSFISCRNMEKLDKLLKNQEVQLKFMNRLKNML